MFRFYCNNENLSSNHGVCLIGWDDTYSKTNFKAGCQPLSDGAYIALNSYGEDYNGNGGYFYISYDDIFVEQLLFGIQDISKKDYDHLYQYDELGSNPLAAIYNTINNKEIYGANYFKKESNKIEKLSEVGLFIETSCDVTIYLKNNPSDLNIKDLQPIATKKDLPHGYHIVKLNTPIEVGNNFAIIVKYSNDFIATLPIESNSLYVLYWDTAKANSGESFFSIDGEKWQDITSQAGKENANMCIKAFTIESNAISNSNYIQNSNWNILTNNNTKLLTGIDIDSTISQVLSSSNYISGYTAKAYINDVEVTSGKITTGTVIKIYNGSNIVDEYTTVIYGDTTGDGSVVSLDALVIIKNKLQTEKFKNNIFEQAGRVTLNTRNSNGVPSAVDALAVVKYKLGLEKITQ